MLLIERTGLARLVPYNDKVHRKQFFELNVEYLTWFVDEATERHHIDLQSMTGPTVREYVATVIDDYAGIRSSEGIIYVLEADGEVVGMGALKKLEEGVGELKRMYISPNYRGQGFGQALLTKLLDRSRNLGYSIIRLDSADFMTTAHRIYRSAGFTERDEYVGCEIPEWYRPYSVFMEKQL